MCSRLASDEWLCRCEYRRRGDAARVVQDARVIQDVRASGRETRDVVSMSYVRDVRRQKR